MTTRRPLLALFALCAAPILHGCAAVPQATGPAPTLAIVGGTVIDATGAAPQPNTTVLVRDDRIVAVGRMPVPKGTKIVDASGRTVLPGLIESNGHVTFSGQIDHAAYFGTRLDQLHDVGVRNLRNALDQGITTIRDTYGPRDFVLRLRNEARSGEIGGARLYVSGPIINYISVLDLPTDVALDPAQVARAREQLDLFVTSGTAAVRRLAGAGVDFIKVSADTGPPYVPPELGVDALTEIVAESHRLGLRTTSHTFSVQTLRNALDAGFDAFEHPELMRVGPAEDREQNVLPRELADEIARRRIYSVPLIVAVEVYPKFLREPALLDDPAVVAGVPPDMVAEARAYVRAQASHPEVLASFQEILDQARRNLQTLIAAHAPIAMGTDKGTRLNFFESANHVRELQAYVELGMAPMEALVSATRHGAELLGVQRDLGTIEPGKLADIIIVEGDPLQDINALRRVRNVIVGGRLAR
jgi:imidazolonepropionase-like amidohydrolase